MPITEPATINVVTQDMHIETTSATMENARQKVIQEIMKKWPGSGYSVNNEVFNDTHYSADYHIIVKNSVLKNKEKNDTSTSVDGEDNTQRSYGMHIPRYILVMSGNNDTWGERIGAGTSFNDKIVIVPTVGDNEDHENISDADYKNIMDEKIPDTLSVLMKKYRTDTVAFIQPDNNSYNAILIQGDYTKKCNLSKKEDSKPNLSDILPCLK